MFLFDVTSEFNKRCRELCADQPELYTFSRDHERKPVVLKNLCQQIVQYEQRFKSRLEKEKRDLLIDTVARMFIQGIREQRDQALWSEARKSQERNRDNLKKEIAGFLKEVE